MNQKAQNNAKQHNEGHVSSKSYYKDRRKLSLVLLLCCLTLHLPSLASASCSITNVTHRSDSASTFQTNVILLTWSTNCQNVIRFKIYPRHLRYKACRGPEPVRSEQDQNQVLETSHNSYRLKTLIAHSDYSVRISAIMADGSRAEKTIQMSTFQDYPETRARLSTSNTQSYLQALRFFWNPPSVSDCRNQRGIMSGYRLVLSGLDPWVLSPEPIATQDVDEHLHEIYFENLMAFTNYKLEIFTKNKGGLVSKNYPLKLKARTLSTIPKPPTDLKLSPSSSSVHLSWAPPYPPTGKVEKYIMRIGVNGSGASQSAVIWRRREEIPANQSCIKGVNADANDKTPICHVVTSLHPDTLYIFEIQTVNENITTPSEFSNAVLVTTEPATILPGQGTSSAPGNNSSTTSFNNLTPKPSFRTPRADLNRSDSESNILIVILGLVVAIIALVVIGTALVYKIKMKKLKMRYEQQNSGSGGSNRMSANTNSTALTYLPGSDVTNMSFVQSWTNSIEEIQSRRLPEPPPSSHDNKRHSRASDFDAAGYTNMTGAGYSSVDDRVNLRTPPPSRYIREDSTTDLDGYLKPTFNSAEETPNCSSTPKASPGTASSGKVIPAESYEAPQAVNQVALQRLGLPTTESSRNSNAGGGSCLGEEYPSFDSSNASTAQRSSTSSEKQLSESQQPLMLPKSVQV